MRKDWTPMRPEEQALHETDEQLAWTVFQNHLARCPDCSDRGECPEGAKLLKAWGEADAQLGPPWTQPDQPLEESDEQA